MPAVKSNIDQTIGANLRALRRTHNLSQRDLAAILGVTFQQVQKYERGSNRLSAANLYILAGHFGVSYDYFFGDENDVSNIVQKISTIKDKTLRTKVLQIIDVLAA